jgi:hypothetical protein
MPSGHMRASVALSVSSKAEDSQSSKIFPACSPTLKTMDDGVCLLGFESQVCHIDTGCANEHSSLTAHPVSLGSVSLSCGSTLCDSS